MKLFVKMLVLLASVKAYSQTEIAGKIQDEKGNAVSGAVVKIENFPYGAKSDANGNYKIEFATGGSYTMTISYLGYQKQTIPFKINTNEKLTRDITVESTNKKVKEVKVRGNKNKGSEAATIEEQKKSTSIIEIMGSQEMSRKGASDAGAAVTKMVGISREEGSNQVFVRGLGDRYNSTLLNGMFLPSDNPEFKNISLDYFPIDIIQSINVSKTYNNTLLGDFGGATINISTKEYYGKPYLSAGIKSGFNTQAISNPNLGSGMGLLGNIDFQDYPTLKEGEFVERNWQPEERTMPKLNSEISLNGGWSKTFKNSSKMSLFGTLSVANKYQYNSGLTKIIYADGTVFDSFNKTSSTYSVNKTGMINFAYQLNENFKTKVNLLAFETSANQSNEYSGYTNSINDNIWRRRMINDLNNLYIIQWLNEYKYSNRLSFSAGVAANFIKNDQPNRLTTSLIRRNNGYTFLANRQGDHSSYYQNLADKDFTVNLGTKIKLITDSLASEDKLSLNIGYTYRMKDREFNQLEYVFNKPIDNLYLASGLVISPETIDEAFSQKYFNLGYYTLRDDNPLNSTVDLSKYTGDLTVHSPSIGIDFNPTKNIFLNFGARMDLIDQNVVWSLAAQSPTKGNVNFNTFKVLPFINAKQVINETQNVKLAFSKTYTIPQFKELAPFLYYDIATFNTRGNPYVYASDNYNLDLKYEWFPSRTELFSLGGFGKLIQNPINKVMEASTGTDQMTFVNSGEQAIVLGAELELKKKIFDFTEKKDSSFKHALVGGFNISALYSHQDLNKDKITKENKGYTSAVFTNTNSGIQGASPLIFNIDLSYRMKFKRYEPQFTLVMNYFMDRLYALGAQSSGDVYEKGVLSLDFISKHKLNDKLSVALNFRNILNPDIDRYQEVVGKDIVTVSSFTKGIDLSFGINYNF